MSSVATRPSPAVQSTPRVRVAGPLGRTGLLSSSVGVLVFVGVASLAVGSKNLALAQVWHELWHDTGSQAGSIVRGLRLDRTAVAVCVGGALGMAGALMQALTRNPLADPGLLGVNAGSAAAVVTAISLLGWTSPLQYAWLALVGAAAASLAVYALGSGGRSSATPVRLALAGAALTAVLTSYISGLTLLNQQAFDSYRFWAVGSVVNRDLTVLGQLGAFLALGALLGLCLARPLNTLAMGEDTGRALGVSVGRTRVVTAVAITLLCGAATAVAGPVGFVGLTVPHLARLLVGPDQRWVLPLSTTFGALLLLGADILGRVVARPSEIEAGIMTAVVGAPVFIFLVRRRRLVQL